MERTLLLLKPDALKRRLVGRIIQRLEDKGLDIVGVKMMQLTEEVLAEAYEAHREKSFYRPLLEFMQSGPVVVIALEGRDAVAAVKKMTGATFGWKAEPGTIRGDLTLDQRANLVHAPDTEDAAQRELALFFKAEEIFPWPKEDLKWIYHLEEGEKP
ncbi:MAG: nucleoside diphosphate kinase [Planctomycetes bacterium DG_23]|nr:MAG: nucleoside diphosphate kinase [Planctomycetes bacterium DG_23]